MCGIVGFLDFAPASNGLAAGQLIADMRDCLAHRGPDDSGTWVDPAGGLAFGFRRLSIVDLSPAGHQPMQSADGRYVIIMNGEIYNHREIRAEIDAKSGGMSWCGTSDTEVLLEAISLWGIEAAIARINGMFAFALWNRESRVLWLARDRVGKKPLYYGRAGDSLVFGSELNALWRHPQFDFEISLPVLTGFLRLGYIRGPNRIFTSMHMLEPGHMLQVKQGYGGQYETPRPFPYWSLRSVALAGLESQAAGHAVNTEELEALITDAVQLRMVADVPVGALLSGGIDSSLVTAIMAAGSSTPVHTFGIGFNVPQLDEAPHARLVAEHLGTCHQELYLTTSDVIDVLCDLPGICGEPLADDSMIPMIMLCRMARASVTVALTGDGGDEFFAGYQRYAAITRWIAGRATAPRSMLMLGSRLLDSLAGAASVHWGNPKLQRRLQILSHLLRYGDPEKLYSLIISQSVQPEALLAEPQTASDSLLDDVYTLGQSTAADRMMFMDSMSFLTDDILTKVDRASMSASLEARCPLLDHRLIEMSWRLPSDEKLKLGIGKLPLRRMLYRRVPHALVKRPKMGFNTPLELWLRNELRDYGEALMSRRALGRSGLLNVETCRRMWEDFAHRGRSWHRTIWHLLMFQAWYGMIESVRDGQRTHADNMADTACKAPAVSMG